MLWRVRNSARLARLIFDSQRARSVVITLESRPAMALGDFIILLLWVEVLAMALGLLLLDRSINRK
jgi:hypothetical protein